MVSLMAITLPPCAGIKRSQKLELRICDCVYFSLSEAKLLLLFPFSKFHQSL